MAETSKFRSAILDFIYKNFPNILNWDVIDIGSGDDPLLPDCDKFDLPQPYTIHCQADRLTYRGDARVIDEIVKRKYKVVYSSHLLEDFPRNETIPILRRWISLLVEGGIMIILCPDQKRYEAHCERIGEVPNVHHQIEDFSMAYLTKCFEEIPEMKIVTSTELFNNGDYNFIIVAQKIPQNIISVQNSD